MVSFTLKPVAASRFPMSIQNADIASMFNEIADLLEIEGENVFCIRTYRNAARTVGDLRRSVQSMVKRDDDLTDLAGRLSERMQPKTLRWRE